MSVQRLVWERFIDPVHGSEKMKLVKAEGVGFPADPEGVDNIDDRVAHFKKYEVGTIISIYDFLTGGLCHQRLIVFVVKKRHLIFMRWIIILRKSYALLVILMTGKNRLNGITKKQRSKYVF